MKRMKVLALVLAAIMVLALLPAITFADVEDGYYLGGRVKGVYTWDPSEFDASRKFYVNPANKDELMLNTILYEGDEFKAVHVVNNEIVAYYPDPGGNWVAHAGFASGNVNIYLKPNDSNPLSVDSANRKPFISCNSMTLGSQLFVNFFVYPAGQNLDNYTMNFSIDNGNNAPTVVENVTKTQGLTTNYYGNCDAYTVGINILQVAQTITATLMKGNVVVDTQTYSAKEYFETFAANSNALFNSQPQKVKNMINATWIYAKKVQAFLISEMHLESVGYTALDPNNDINFYYDYAPTAENYFPSGVNDKGLVKSEDWDNLFDDTAYQLVLDSAIAIRVRLTPNDANQSITVEEGAGVETSGNSKIITISGIYATAMTTQHTITAGNETLRFSATSYVRSMLDHSDTLTGTQKTLWSEAAYAIAMYAACAAVY